jgi:hypothetical protein
LCDSAKDETDPSWHAETGRGDSKLGTKKKKHLVPKLVRIPWGRKQKHLHTDVSDSDALTPMAEEHEVDEAKPLQEEEPVTLFESPPDEIAIADRPTLAERPISAMISEDDRALLEAAIVGGDDQEHDDPEKSIEHRADALIQDTLQLFQAQSRRLRAVSSAAQELDVRIKVASGRKASTELLDRVSVAASEVTRVHTS